MQQILEKTISNLISLENKSVKGGYNGDATEYAFRRHTLKLLKGLKAINVDQLSKQNKVFRKRIEKLEQDLDHYIKNYPEEVKPNSSQH